MSLYSNQLRLRYHECINLLIQNRSYGNKKRFKRISESSINLPDFKSLLRQFYKKSHPDLLRSSNPEASIVNDQSFKELNGILSIISSNGEYPPQMIKTIPFYVLKEDKSISRFQLTLRTAGGDSRKQLARCFSVFFRDTGILQSETFTWNEEYFQPVEGLKESEDPSKQ